MQKVAISPTSLLSPLDSHPSDRDPCVCSFSCGDIFITSQNRHTKFIDSIRLKLWRLRPQKIGDSLRQKPYLSVLQKEPLHCSARCSSFKVSKNPRKFCFDSHGSCSKHRASLKRWDTNKLKRLPTFNEIFDPRANRFHQALTEMLVSCNISISKINRPNPTEFLETWCGQKCPSSSTLRKGYVSSIYDKIIEEIRSSLKDHWIYLQVDEARISNRRVHSIIVGQHNGKTSKSFLLNVIESDVAANNRTVLQFIDDSIAIDRITCLFFGQADDSEYRVGDHFCW